MARTKSDYGTRHGALVECYVGTAMTHHKLYCYPGHKKLRERLHVCHGIDVSDRTLCRDIKKMEDEGLFKRQQRDPDGPNKTGKFKTCLYYLKRPIFKLAAKLKKWSSKLSYAFRTPTLAYNSSPREMEILKNVAPGVGKLLKPGLEGGPKP
jgi:DNA-binding HxlR family transcriptional regulator